MKLALLTNGFPPFTTGGMQTHSLNMVKALSQHGWAIDAYYPAEFQTWISLKDNQCLPLTPDSRLQLHRFAPPSPRRYPGHYVSECRALSDQYLRRYLAYPNADLIYAKGMMAHAFIEARDRHGIDLPPIITNIHGYESFQRTSGVRESLGATLLRPAFRRVIQRSDFVVSYGGRITELLTNTVGVSSDKILEMPGAVDEEMIRAPWEPDSFEKRTFGFVGRYERRKGLEELASCLQSSNSQIDLQIVGDMPSHVARRFPTTTRFYRVVSDRERLRSILDGIDVLVCPSRSEGMPNVIMEAMARRCAIIATDVGATSLLVSDANGELIPPDNRDRLAAAVQRLADISSSVLGNLQAESYRRIQDSFRWRIVGERLHHQLCETIGLKGRVARAA